MYQQGNDNRYEEYIAEHIKKGTTTCALTCKDGVVLAQIQGQVLASLLLINML